MKKLLFKGIYKNKSREVIGKTVKEEGFHPVIILNGPGDVYPSHEHPETKLLAILDGSMTVTAGGDEYFLEQGDKLVIPGNTIHSAKVGVKGCTFFWSEKVV